MRFGWWITLIALSAVLATPSRADYVFRWSSTDTRFPVFAQGTGVPTNSIPFAPTFVGDVDGDGALEIVGANGSHENVVIRDAVTGTLEGTLHVLADAGVGVGSISVLNLDQGTPEIIVTLDNAVGIAVYGWSSTTSTESPSAVQSLRSLKPASPNPFGPRTTLGYALDAAGQAELRIYDIGGRLVRQFVEPMATAGEHKIQWDGADESGQHLAPNTYFYELRVNGRVIGSQRAVLLH